MGTLRHMKVNRQHSASKVGLTLFFDVKGLILTELFHSREQVNEKSLALKTGWKL